MSEKPIPPDQLYTLPDGRTLKRVTLSDLGLLDEVEASVLDRYARLRVQMLFTMDDVAILLGVSKRQAQNFADKGHLKTVLPLGAIRGRMVTRAQLQLFIEASEVAAGFACPNRLRNLN